MIAFEFLMNVVTQIPHSAIIGNGTGIAKCLVEWLRFASGIIQCGRADDQVFSSPQHSNLDMRCRSFTFDICQTIAQNSDAGRRALIDNNVLPLLVRLSADGLAINVIGACKLLHALAHSGTFRTDILSAGVKPAMERITRYVYLLI